MPSDAFAGLRAWLQWTANISSEEEPFLTASPAPSQEPHDGSDVPEGDEDLEGLFTDFSWDTSAHGSPEVWRRVFLCLHTPSNVLSVYPTLSSFPMNATIGINPMDTLLHLKLPGDKNTRPHMNTANSQNTRHHRRSTWPRAG